MPESAPERTPPDDITEGLRERLTEVATNWMRTYPLANYGFFSCADGDSLGQVHTIADSIAAAWGRDIADRMLTALAGDPGDLPARMAEAMRRALGSQLDHFPNAPEFLAAAAMSVRWEAAVQQAAEVERLRAELAEPRPTFKAFRLVDGQRMAATQRAEKAEAERDALKAAIERVRAEHFACRPHRCGDEASGMDGKERCHGCRRVWPCPTIAALDAPETPGDGPAKHIGGRANAEDCPACRPEIDKTVLYPYICPGEPETPGDAETEDRWRHDEQKIDGGFSGCEYPRLWPPHPASAPGDAEEATDE